jgi:hypothetical protein
MRKVEGELYSVKELAAKLKRSERYVWWMRRRGFPMPGDRATLTAAIVWLAKNPFPSQRNNGASSQ